MQGERNRRMTAVLDEENAPVLARLALPHFGLSADAPIHFVKLRENCVFRADDETGAVALRLHRPGYRTEEEIVAESVFIAALAQEGIPVVDPVPTVEGGHAVSVRAGGVEVVVDAQRWVSSAEPLGSAEAAWDGSSALTPEDFEKLGRLAAKMHTASERLTATHRFLRAPWDHEGLVGSEPLWGDPRGVAGLASADMADLTDAMRAVGGVLREYGTDPSIYGAIHADFTPENILVKDGGYIVIDFDDFGEGWHMFDLATVLFFYQPHPRYRDFAAALFRGYRTERLLRDEDEALLSVFLIARGLTYLGWASTRPETEIASFIAEEVAPVVVHQARALVVERAGARSWI